MTFIHIPHRPLPKLETRLVNHKRFYVTPQGTLCPSVTTVVSIIEKDAIANWKKKVGDDVAALVSNNATGIGSEMHKIIEEYLNNRDISQFKNLLPLAHFHNIKEFLDKIDNIHGTESQLWSNELRLAGTTDCIGEYDKVLSVIDFKTTKKEKKEDWLKKYFLQETAYALMTEERLGIKPEQIVTIISGEDGSRHAIIKNIQDYKGDLLNVIDMYHREVEQPTLPEFGFPPKP